MGWSRQWRRCWGLGAETRTTRGPVVGSTDMLVSASSRPDPPMEPLAKRKKAHFAAFRGPGWREAAVLLWQEKGRRRRRKPHHADPDAQGKRFQTATCRSVSAEGPGGENGISKEMRHWFGQGVATEMMRSFARSEAPPPNGDEPGGLVSSTQQPAVPCFSRAACRSGSEPTSPTEEGIRCTKPWCWLPTQTAAWDNLRCVGQMM